MTKLKSKCSLADVELIYRTCTVHAGFKDDFGIFCAGMASLIANVFSAFRDEKRYAIIDVDLAKMAFATLGVMESFEQAKQDLIMAKRDKMSNENIRKKIMEIVRQSKIEHQKKLSGG